MIPRLTSMPHCHDAPAWVAAVCRGRSAPSIPCPGRQDAARTAAAPVVKRTTFARLERKYIDVDVGVDGTRQGTTHVLDYRSIIDSDTMPSFVLA